MEGAAPLAAEVLWASDRRVGSLRSALCLPCLLSCSRLVCVTVAFLLYFTPADEDI